MKTFNVKKLFTMDGQHRFALLSGDYNPMHVDEEKARRYLFGKPVVHGLHLLCWILDEIAQRSVTKMGISGAKVKFLKPNFPGQELQLTVDVDETGRFLAKIYAESLLTTSMELQVVAQGDANGEMIIPENPPRQPVPSKSIADIANETGKFPLHFNPTLAKDMFPAIACWMPVQIAVLLATTRLIGNQCPGLHSVFSELAFTGFDNNIEKAEGTFSYQVTKTDNRFKLVNLSYQGAGCSGKITSFVRPAPMEQKKIADIDSHVLKNIPPQKALIIGGSRGIGEVMAKMIAAAGNETLISYNLGAADAQRVADDIISSGRKCNIVQIDIRNIDAQVIEEIISTHQISHIYYFASPQIETGSLKNISGKMATDFFGFYVLSFIRIANAAAQAGCKFIFYPSTVFIEEMPRNFPEYIITKAAGEKACELLSKQYPGLTIVAPRLPKMATDQTAGLSNETLASPEDILALFYNNATP